MRPPKILDPHSHRPICFPQFYFGGVVVWDLSGNGGPAAERLLHVAGKCWGGMMKMMKVMMMVVMMIMMFFSEYFLRLRLRLSLEDRKQVNQVLFGRI